MDTLLEFFKHPKHKGLLAHSKYVAQRQNRSCGDECIMSIGESPLIIGYESQGCAVHLASSEIAADICEGLPLEQALNLVKSVINGFDSEIQMSDSRILALYELKSYPVRRKCALLAWYTLCDALEQEYAETAGQ
jgi:nitrogen fixation NifU-like protein